jgi:hypothetical protein
MADEPRETPMGDVGYIAAIVVCRLFARCIVGETLPRHTLAGRAGDDWFAMRLESGYVMLDDPEEQETL